MTIKFLLKLQASVTAPGKLVTHIQREKSVQISKQILISPEKVTKLLIYLDMNYKIRGISKNVKFVKKKGNLDLYFHSKFRFRIENWVDINKDSW